MFSYVSSEAFASHSLLFSSFMSSSQAFQRQVHERLTQLELVNKQYRRLARENRTDAASKLKVMVHEGNQRWDSLQKRVAAVLRRLKVSRVQFINKTSRTTIREQTPACVGPPRADPCWVFPLSTLSRQDLGHLSDVTRQEASRWRRADGACLCCFIKISCNQGSPPIGAG